MRLEFAMDISDRKGKRKMNCVVTPLFLVLVFFGCSNKSVDPPPTEDRFEFSFENDFEGWTLRSTDVDTPPVDLSIQRSPEMARDGRTSLRMSLDNMTDAGKIWVERSFPVKPFRRYKVTAAYSFASKDFGTMNLWRLISSVGRSPASLRTDLEYQGDTGNGADSDVGFRWLEKSYVFSIESGAEGLLYVQIGIWGTWETRRTYYFDGILITISETSEEPPG